jgi:hypothetical protein
LTFMAFAFTLWCPFLLYLNRSSRAPDASMVGLSLPARFAKSESSH